MDGGAANAATEAADGTFTSSRRKRPSRLIDLEQALRRDLADAVMSQASDQLLNGDYDATARPQEVDRILRAPGGADRSYGRG